ncbi:MAG: hydrogenase maturation protease [Bacteroidales bacterium]|nr:hydrogenase maturation protease [Bacteroidales bacterium]
MLSDLQALRQDKNQTILFVGIGNVLRTDDGAGVYISQRITEHNRIMALTVEVSIENYIQKINHYSPDLIILIDGMNFNKDPGYYNLLPVSELMDFTTNTHNISLRNISEYLPGNVQILGIQPESISFGEGLTPCVKKSANEIIRFINSL